MQESEHEVKTTLREDGMWDLTCTCPWTSLATHEKFTDAIARRHYLKNSIWPFDEDLKPENWPYGEE